METPAETVTQIKSDGWGRLAEDAEAELVIAKKRVRNLRIALRIFRANAKNGEFYPEPEPNGAPGQ
jgi:hypothetical protein